MIWQHNQEWSVCLNIPGGQKRGFLPMFPPIKRFNHTSAVVGMPNHSKNIQVICNTHTYYIYIYKSVCVCVCVRMCIHLKTFYHLKRLEAILKPSRVPSPPQEISSSSSLTYPWRRRGATVIFRRTIWSDGRPPLVALSQRLECRGGVMHV